MLGKKTEKKLNSDSIISKFNEMPKEDKIQLVSYLINELKRTHQVSEQELLAKKEACLPIGIFANYELSSLEAIVKYMKEELKLRFSKIAKLLNRSNKTIWATYHKAVKKKPAPFGLVSSDVFIPVSAISNRAYSTLESVVGFLKDLGHSNHEVAQMLCLDDRTIWTIYDRVKKKRGIKSEE